MRLVVDLEQLQTVSVCLGPVELPLTREQVVSLLFGDEYMIVKATNGHALNGHAPRRSSRSELPPGVVGLLPPKPSAKPIRAKGVDQIVFDFLKNREPQSVAEIREMLEKKVPGIGEKHPHSYFPGLLKRLHGQGRLVREGTTGKFRYSLGNTDVIERVPQEKGDETDREKALARDARRKRMDRRVKQGLCMRCDKKHLKDKRLCREHYEMIMKAQKIMVKQRNSDRAQREAVL